MTELPVDRFTTDKAFYGALKLHVYGTVHDSFLTTLLGGKSLVLNESLKLEVSRFTARKIDNLFVSQNGSRPKASAEFFGFTSHKVREKLIAFHEAGIVELLGRGLRDAYTYRWKLPVKHWEICSFMKFRPVGGGDPGLHLESYRIYLNRGTDALTFRDFHALYLEAHEEEYGATRWGKRKFQKIAGTFAYEQYLKSRFERLVEAELLQPVEGGEEGAHRLNPVHREAYHHMDLFFNAVPFHPSRDMCDVCALDHLCQAGSTQRLITSLNSATAAPRAPREPM